MASMMGADFVEAYLLKNACKEKLRRLEEAEARRSSGAAAAAAGSAATMEKEEARSSDRGLGKSGLMKKKVHPRAAGSAMETSSEASS